MVHGDEFLLNVEGLRLLLCLRDYAEVVEVNHGNDQLSHNPHDYAWYCEEANQIGLLCEALDTEYLECHEEEHDQQVNCELPVPAPRIDLHFEDATEEEDLRLADEVDQSSDQHSIVCGKI